MAGRARSTALEITDRHDVHGKDESRREQRKPPDGDVVSRAGAVDEHGHDFAAEKRRHAEETQSGRPGPSSAPAGTFAHARIVARAEIKLRIGCADCPMAL